MVKHRTGLPTSILERLREGAVIPAHPLALHSDRQLATEHQRALSRYYVDAGAGGLAVGVHTTQFAIRERGLYEPVLRLAAETVTGWAHDPIVLIAGVTGCTKQAIEEARTAATLGYHAVLLNLAAFRGAGEAEILEHCEILAAEMPLIGFALLPECGGLHLSYAFWKSFCAIDNVVAIKMAPFNRYRTLDIVRAVADSDAADRITLYTGNDDHIVFDLLAPFNIGRNVEGADMRIRGGLLGHWSVWTKTAVDLLKAIHAVPAGTDVPYQLMRMDAVVTDCNSAIYDAANDFKACIPGCLEVLRRQGLVPSTTCLDPAETLAPGQIDEIDRIHARYPGMNDDAFVAANLHRWLSTTGPQLSLSAA